MFGFFRRPSSRSLTDAVRIAIAQDGMASSVSNPSQLRMVELRGRYSDRQVTYFRVFDPQTTTQRSMDIQRYDDLDLCLDLILRSGHVEKDGVVVLTRPVLVRPAQRLARTQADRTQHADDAHIVRGETGATANASAVEASMPGQAP